jgi:hypothetical protein
VTITRDGSTLYFQPGTQSAVPIEATAEDKFKIDPFVFFEFNAAKREMTVTRAGQKRVFTKEQKPGAPVRSQASRSALSDNVAEDAPCDSPLLLSCPS